MGRGVIKEANKKPSTDFGDNKALNKWIPNSIKEAEMDENSVQVSKISKFNPNFHSTICAQIYVLESD